MELLDRLVVRGGRRRMMTNSPADSTSALLATSTAVLERLNASESPLSIVSESLANLASALGVEQAFVAIDDAQYGRQVFSSGRRPLGDGGDLLFGPPRVRTEPARPMDDAVARLIVATVTTAFERAHASSTTSAAATTAGAEPVRQTSRADELLALLGVATERSARYGWGFTLVLIRVDDADADTARRIETHLRASDTMAVLDDRDVALVLPAASDEQVPTILGRIGQGGTVSTFCYGLATCPGDTADPHDLLALAAARLRDAEATRGEPEVHALEPPTA
jgi:hypothetical protein